MVTGESSARCCCCHVLLSSCCPVVISPSCDSLWNHLRAIHCAIYLCDVACVLSCCEITFVWFFVKLPLCNLSWNRLRVICVHKLFLNRSTASIFRMPKTTSVDGRLLVFLASIATFVWLLMIKPKSVTLAFDRLVSEAGFAFCSCAAFAFFGCLFFHRRSFC
jgi:hypothetical protein